MADSCDNTNFKLSGSNKKKKKINMKKFLLPVLFIALALTGCNRDNKQIPASDKVLTGKLSNGLTYYVRHNEEPKDRASFYIIQNAHGIPGNRELP